MYSHILVAIDGSVHTSKTLPVALELAKENSAAVTVLHVREHARYQGSDVDLGPIESPEDLVESAVAKFREEGLAATGETRRVNPRDTASAIVEVAKASNADLIVMGTRGMTELKSLVLGGVANKVVHHAPCSVLLVR